jgi:hypothetical protein
MLKFHISDCRNKEYHDPLKTPWEVGSGSYEMCHDAILRCDEELYPLKDLILTQISAILVIKIAIV